MYQFAPLSLQSFLLSVTIFFITFLRLQSFKKTISDELPFFMWASCEYPKKISEKNKYKVLNILVTF